VATQQLQLWPAACLLYNLQQLQQQWQQQQQRQQRAAGASAAVKQQLLASADTTVGQTACGTRCTLLRPMRMQTLGCRTMLQQTNLALQLAAVRHGQQLRTLAGHQSTHQSAVVLQPHCNTMTNPVTVYSCVSLWLCRWTPLCTWLMLLTASASQRASGS
jgi:hypothetical protein